MKKSTTSSHVLELEASVTPKQLREIEARQEVARVTYNTCLGRLLKRWRGVNGVKEWREAKNRIQVINRTAEPTAAETKEKKALQQDMKRIEKDFGLTEYQLHAFVKDVNKHFDRRISSSEAQVTATRAFRAFEKYRYGGCRKLRFIPRGESVTVENKSNDFGLRVCGQELVWKDLRAPLIVRKGDKYAEDAFLDKTKYVRLIVRSIRGRKRVFVQIVKEGVPPDKERKAGPADSAVGIDIGPSAVAVYATGNAEAIVEALAPSVVRDERRIRRLSRCISRSLDACNPDAKDEEGCWKKGIKLMKSRRCVKNQAKLADIRRRQAVNRKRDHETLANKIIAMGTDVRAEDTPITSWTARTKETTTRKKDGKIRSKKRLGKSVGHHAPGMFLSIVDRKLAYRDSSLKRVVSRRVKASQLDHASGEYKKKKPGDRWFEAAGERVQRDLYSAWLIAHVKPNMEEVDLAACREDWPNFLRAQAKVLENAPKNLGIF